jgi:hypothetical protein
MRDFLDIAPCSLVGVGRRFRGACSLQHQCMMEAVCTSKTSVYSNQTTRHYTPEGSHLHTRRRQNPKSNIQEYICLLKWCAV